MVKIQLELFKDALNINVNPTSYDPNKNMYLAKPKYSSNLFAELNPTGAPMTKPTLYHNNKFLRNILFLVNIQRVIRLKIKNAVYKINSNVVSDTNIMNMRITEHPTDNIDIKDNEFEITDLF